MCQAVDYAETFSGMCQAVDYVETFNGMCQAFDFVEHSFIVFSYRHELEKLRRAQEEATIQHQEKEDLLLCSHNNHKAEIERERHKLQAHIRTLQELKASTQNEVKAAERDYIRQKKECKSTSAS